jgi:hypothetical protein
MNVAWGLKIDHVYQIWSLRAACLLCLSDKSQTVSFYNFPNELILKLKQFVPSATIHVVTMLHGLGILLIASTILLERFLVLGLPAIRIGTFSRHTKTTGWINRLG